MFKCYDGPKLFYKGYIQIFAIKRLLPSSGETLDGSYSFHIHSPLSMITFNVNTMDKHLHNVTRRINILLSENLKKKISDWWLLVIALIYDKRVLSLHFRD